MKKRLKEQELTEVPAHFDCSPDEMARALISEHGFLDGIQRFYEWCADRRKWEKSHRVSLSPLEFDRTGLPRDVVFWRYGKGQFLHRREF